MNFIGVDIAWAERNPSGLCWAIGEAETGKVQELTILRETEEMVEWIERRKGKGCVVAVDGPILCPGGYRECDRQVAKEFWKYRAGPYPVNREKALRCIRFARMLEEKGFCLNPYWRAKSSVFSAVEVYPHPALVRFLSLSRIIPYKRGNPAERQRQLLRYFRSLKNRLPQSLPRLSFPSTISQKNIIGKKGKMLKETEDMLDAYFCCYLAFHFWFWGVEKWEIFGNYPEGYILIPKGKLVSGGAPDISRFPPQP